MRKYKDGKLMSVICNKCSKVADELWNDDNDWMIEPFKEIRLGYGYGSELYDLNIVSFDLCEYCVRDFVETFNISPKIEEYDWLDGTILSSNYDDKGE